MSGSLNNKRRWPMVVAAAIAVIAVGCSSDDSGSSDGGDGGSETTVDASILGTENPATGEALKVGFVYDGVTEAVDNSDDLAAAQAATDYVNEYMGGLEGRKLELEVCATDQTPAGAGDCVTQFANAKVPVVLNGVTGQAGSLFEPLQEAGIPVFVTAADPRDAGADIMTNGVVALAAGPAKVFADQGIKKATVIGIDVPAASAALKQSAPLFYENAGVEVDVVLIPPDTADMTPNIQAAMTSDPGGMTVVGDPLFCTKAMAGIASANFEGQLVVIPQCLNESFLEATTNLDGAIMLSTATSDPDSEEYQLYEAVMQTYAEDAGIGGAAPQSYQAVMGFVAAMKGATGEITPDVVRATLKAMAPTEMPLGGGIMFQCNGQQVAIVPAICSTDVLQTTLNAEGEPGEFTILEGADLLDLGG